MSKEDELKKRLEEALKKREEKVRIQNKIDEELRRINEQKKSEKARQDESIKGKPTSGRPEKDD